MKSARSVVTEVDNKLSGISKRYVVGLTVVRGQVEILGRMEGHRSWHTDHRSGTAGKLFQNGWFLAGTRGSSDTAENISYTINLVKVGEVSIRETAIPSSSLYDSLAVGDSIACILSSDKSRMFAVNNFSNGTNLAWQPNWGGLATGRLLFGVVSGIGALCLVRSFSSASGFILSLAAVAVGVVGFRIAYLALRRSQEIWLQALGMIAKP